MTDPDRDAEYRAAGARLRKPVFRGALLCAYAAGILTGALLAAFDLPATAWTVPLIVLFGAGVGAIVLGGW